jgi:hypothetical protein
MLNQHQNKKQKNHLNISEYQIQAPLEYSLKKKSKILQILQLAIYRLICNIHVCTSI